MWWLIPEISFGISYSTNASSKETVFESELSVERDKIVHSAAHTWCQVWLPDSLQESRAEHWLDVVDLFQSHYAHGIARTSWSQPLESNWESSIRSARLGSILRCRDIHGYLVALVLAWVGEVQGHYSLVPWLSLCQWHHSCVRTLQTQVAVNWLCDSLLLRESHTLKSLA